MWRQNQTWACSAQQDQAMQHMLWYAGTYLADQALVSLNGSADDEHLLQVKYECKFLTVHLPRRGRTVAQTTSYLAWNSQAMTVTCQWPDGAVHCAVRLHKLPPALLPLCAIRKLPSQDHDMISGFWAAEATYCYSRGCKSLRIGHLSSEACFLEQAFLCCDPGLMTSDERELQSYEETTRTKPSYPETAIVCSDVNRANPSRLRSNRYAGMLLQVRAYWLLCLSFALPAPGRGCSLNRSCDCCC